MFKFDVTANKRYGKHSPFCSSRNRRNRANKNGVPAYRPGRCALSTGFDPREAAELLVTKRTRKGMKWQMELSLQYLADLYTTRMVV
jgi:hypothetical protein